MDFSEKVLDALIRAEVTIASSVPDTWISPILDLIDARDDIFHVPAAREEDALGICCGATLSGKRAICLMQNSGALNCGGAFATFVLTYGIPLVLLIADRGRMGDVTTGHFGKARAFRPYLNSLQIPYFDLEPDFDQKEMIQQSYRLAELSQRPVALLISENSLGGQE